MKGSDRGLSSNSQAMGRVLEIHVPLSETEDYIQSVQSPSLTSGQDFQAVRATSSPSTAPELSSILHSAGLTETSITPGGSLPLESGGAISIINGSQPQQSRIPCSPGSVSPGNTAFGSMVSAGSAQDALHSPTVMGGLSAVEELPSVATGYVPASELMISSSDRTQGSEDSPPQISPFSTVLLPGSRWSDEDLPPAEYEEEPQEGNSGELTRAQLAHTASEVSIELYGSAPLESTHDWGGRKSSDLRVQQSPRRFGPGDFSQNLLSGSQTGVGGAIGSTGYCLLPASSQGELAPEALPSPASAAATLFGSAVPTRPSALFNVTHELKGFGMPPLPQGSHFFKSESRDSADGARRAATASQGYTTASPYRHPMGGNAPVGPSPGESVSGESATPMSDTTMVRHCVASPDKALCCSL